jgi:hypothetical protein
MTEHLAIPRVSTSGTGWRALFTAENALLLYALTFTYFLCSQIAFNASFIYNLGFYAVAVPAFLWALRNDRALLSQVPRTLGLRATQAFFLFVIVHALVFRYPEQSPFRTVGDTLLNALFMLMALVMFAQQRVDIVKLLRWLSASVIVFGVVSMAYHAILETPDMQFIPLGRAHNPIPTGNIYAFLIIRFWEDRLF